MESFDKLDELVPYFTLGLLTLLPFFIAWILLKSLFKRLKKHNKAQNPAIIFVSKASNISIITIATITLLGTLGVDVSAILAGLGLTGFALGFALKDVLSSGIAGILILFNRPFKLHSTIMVMEVEGEVIDIDLRYTTLQGVDSKHLIPNSKLISEKISVLKE